MANKTKAELVEENKELKDGYEEYEDKYHNTLEELEVAQTENEDLRGQLKNTKHMAKAVESKDKEISNLRQELQEKRREVKKVSESEKTNSGHIQKLTENNTKLLEQNKIFKKENDFLYQYINKYRNAFKSFMMNIQGGLDNSIDFEKLLTDKFQQEQNTINNEEGDK